MDQAARISDLSLGTWLELPAKKDRAIDSRLQISKKTGKMSERSASQGLRR
jgi:hypothetical protein